MQQKRAYKKKHQVEKLADALAKELRTFPGKMSFRAAYLIKSLKKLIGELRFSLSKQELTKALGAVALLFGFSMSYEGQAQNFAAPLTSPFGLSDVDLVSFPTFVDLDTDGDLDLMLGEYYGNFRYFENTGDALNPAFGPAQINPFSIAIPGSVYTDVAAPTFADLDGDGDVDMLVGTSNYYSGTLVYYENRGTATAPLFDTAQVSPFGLTDTYFLAIPRFADLDADGDQDLLVGELYGNMQYFENTGSASTPQFAAPVGNPHGLTPSYIIASPSFADLDRDGDLDLLVGEFGGSINYYENTGSAAAPAFAAPLQNPFGISPGYYQAQVAAADLDGDGDADVLVAEYADSLLYYENTELNIGLDDTKQAHFQLFPNPTVDRIKIEGVSEGVSYEIRNMQGQRVKEGIYGNVPINVQALPAGQYTLRLREEDDVPLTQNFGKL